MLAVEELAGELAEGLPARLEDALRVAEAINLMLSFRKRAPAYPATVANLRGFLHVLLGHCRNQAQRATVVCALRGVGDEESIRIIGDMRRFTGPWAGIEAAACKAIRQRLRKERGGLGRGEG